MVGWHHQLNGHEFEQAPGDGKDREAWRAAVHGSKYSDTTAQLDNNNYFLGLQNYCRQQLLLLLLLSRFSRVQLFVTPFTTAWQASLSFTISWCLLKLMSIELVMPSNHLILCNPLLFLPSIFLSLRVFSNKLALPIR